MAAGEQVEGVGHDVEHGLERLDRTCGRAWRVENQAGADRAGSGSGQAAERAHQAHGFGQAWRLALQHSDRAFRRQVARPEAGAAGRDNEPGEAPRRLAQRMGYRLGAIGGDRALDHIETCLAQPRLERLARLVLARAGHHAVRHGDDLRLQRHPPSLPRPRPRVRTGG